uniref:TFIIS N-terminal domain-containing protein n=1 Tax=Glossina brevipalpis TaxID=37001 RepID=A0A1A9W0K7_9MUSC
MPVYCLGSPIVEDESQIVTAFDALTNKTKANPKGTTVKFYHNFVGAIFSENTHDQYATGVRILAKRLVEQWLKIVTDNPESSGTALKTPVPTQAANQNQSINKAMTPQQSNLIKTPASAAITPVAISVSVQQSSTTVNTASLTNNGSLTSITAPSKSEMKQPALEDLQEQNEKEKDDKGNAQQEDEQEEESQVEQDPFGEVQDVAPTSTSYTLTPAQKKASESGLVYKIVVKDGQQVLAKVAKPVPIVKLSASAISAAVCTDHDEEKSVNDSIAKEEEDTEDGEVTNSVNESTVATEAEEDDNSSSLDKTEKESENNSSTEEEIDTAKSKHKSSTEADKKFEDKKAENDKEKSSSTSRKEHRRSKDSKDVKERRSSSSGLERDKEKDKDGKSKSSSSSGHKSSSHKSSSSKSSSSSSSSKSKSSSSSHRSSSDKHRSDKDRSSSNKDKEKERSSSSSSSGSKHKSSSKSSSSSSSSSYSTSTKDKHRDKEREKSSSSSSLSSSNKSKDKERADKDTNQIDKDRTTSNHEKSNNNISLSSSMDKLGRIPKKPKDDTNALGDEVQSKQPTSITIPSKKASISIEIRRDSEKAKTVKTYKSQFRSHGLTEEAPPPPSRKGLKKPSFGTHTPGTILPTSLPSSLKRSSPTPRDSPSEKRSKIDLNNISLANEKPGAIKLIPPKKSSEQIYSMDIKRSCAMKILKSCDVYVFKVLIRCPAYLVINRERINEMWALGVVVCNQLILIQLSTYLAIPASSEFRQSFIVRKQLKTSGGLRTGCTKLGV